MSLAVGISLGGLVLVVIVHAVTSAFMAGRLFQRVSTLEKRDDTLARLDSTVTRMDANMGHMASSIDELKGKLEWATDVAPTRPPQARRRGGA